jgi:membrane dipeptidase
VCCRSLNDIPRNLTDEQIAAIAEKDGVIAVTFAPGLLGGKGDLEMLLRHVDHLVKLAGANHVAFGSDFMYFFDHEEYHRVTFAMGTDLKGKRPPPVYPEGLTDTSEILAFTRALVSQGYSDKEIQGILGANFLRLFERVAG